MAKTHCRHSQRLSAVMASETVTTCLPAHATARTRAYRRANWLRGIKPGREGGPPLDPALFPCHLLQCYAVRVPFSAFEKGPLSLWHSELLIRIRGCGPHPERALGKNVI